MKYVWMVQDYNDTTNVRLFSSLEKAKEDIKEYGIDVHLEKISDYQYNIWNKADIADTENWHDPYCTLERLEVK